MLRPQDERAITDLFDRLRNAERHSGPPDAEAEALIRQKLTEHPAAAYYMAQAIVVQEAALREQQQRIEALEDTQRQGSAGFLGSIFGGGGDQRRPQPQQAPVPYDEPRRPGPWDRPTGGGFLAGAAQTALGVTGGMLLGSAISGMFSQPAHAEEIVMVPEHDLDQQDVADGGDWGDGFDSGGEF